MSDNTVNLEVVEEDSPPMALIIISFQIPEDDPGIELFQSKMSAVKPLFVDNPEVHVYGAVRETADVILTVLNREVQE